MKTTTAKNHSQKAYALATVMVMGGIAIAIYAGAAKWTATSSMLNARHNTYNSAVAAAEGATEQVLSYVERDFVNQSYSPTSLDGYRSLVPTNDWAAQYQFSDARGGVNQTYVSSSTMMMMTKLSDQFAGLYGWTYDCTVRSAAKPLGTPYDMDVAVQQDLELAAIPVFQFAIFYGLNLEINPGPPMKITGKVHSNMNLYTAPGSSLEYQDIVTAVGEIYNHRAPGDPLASGNIAPVYDMTNQPTPHASSLTLPIGTNNRPDTVHAILEVPPFNEDPQSPPGRQRYYNNADLILTVTPTNVVLKTGQWDGHKDVTPDAGSGTNASYSFLQTTNSFYDAREQKSTLETDINLGLFSKWLTNAGAPINSRAAFTLGHAVNSVYVNDQRTKSGSLTAVRVSNGQKLPPAGLTVATPQPLYVQGNFNAPITTPGSTNTSSALPASLAGDSITVLSSNWQDGNSTKPVTSRPALDTTVNAAFLAGIVQTTNASGVGHYSGGVENFPRFLEDWGSSGKTFTYNGSMVVLFPSKYATNWWNNPGTGSGNYYNAPTRRWAFDNNFLDYKKLPPATPSVRQMIRGSWNVVAVN